ncbi:MAG: lipoprotein-releasing ABC transporter permease subunit [Gammaproteobacteria bacterium]|jgi:lipoprotein-releasing system permease protein
MFKPLELYIGLRYTRARSRNHFISFISASSMLGVMLGVIALIVVLSVMNGFHKEVRERILGMTSHASVRSVHENMSDWKKAMKLAGQHPEVIGAAAFIEGQAMLVNRSYVSGAVIRGIFPIQEPAVSDVGEHMVTGQLIDLKAGEYGIIIGQELANILGLLVGDKVTVVTPQASITPIGTMPRLKRFTVTGIFEVGMGEYDRGIALVHARDAAKLYQMGESVTGVRLKLKDLFMARKVATELAVDMDGLYRISDWTQEHRNFFSALATEKRMMALILLLIVAVAAFNIVSTLVMVVTDKQSDIAILKTLGATSRMIMGIFIFQGMVIGLIGTLLGMTGGVLIAENLEQIVSTIEQVFHVQFIDPNIYYINRLPSDLHWNDVWLIGGSAFLISLLATLYPAWLASRTQPAEALRYE